MIKLSRGFDIKLLGKPEQGFLDVGSPQLYALKPADVIGNGPIPKLHKAIGDKVLAGDRSFSTKTTRGYNLHPR